MSTIAKLDRSVRLDRYLRKKMRRDMQTELTKISRLMGVGQKQLGKYAEASKKGLPVSPLVAGPIKDQVTNLFRAKIVTELMFKHITKLCKDPARSGERKEAILARLGAKAT